MRQQQADGIRDCRSLTAQPAQPSGMHCCAIPLFTLFSLQCTQTALQAPTKGKTMFEDPHGIAQKPWHIDAGACMQHAPLAGEHTK
jgi:hypothetical protein